MERIAAIHQRGKPKTKRLNAVGGGIEFWKMQPRCRSYSIRGVAHTALRGLEDGVNLRCEKGGVGGAQQWRHPGPGGEHKGRGARTSNPAQIYNLPHGRPHAASHWLSPFGAALGLAAPGMGSGRRA